MHFNGLLKKLGNVDVSELIVDCQQLFFSQDQNKYCTNIKEFNKSRWAVIEVSYDNVSKYNRYFCPTNSYYSIINSVLNIIGHNYYVVSSMLMWVNPDQKIEKHIDLQHVYAHTRRIHVQLLQNENSFISVWAGLKEYKINVNPGFVYELNNRSYHAVTNQSKEHIYALLVIDFGLTNQVFYMKDNVEKNLKLKSTTNLPLWAE